MSIISNKPRRNVFRKLAPVILVAGTFGFGAVADAQTAAAAAPAVTITCDPHSNSIIAEAGDDHMYWLWLERWNGREWKAKGESGWRYLVSTFDEDGWGNPLTNGYYRMKGVSYDLRSGWYDEIKLDAIDFQNAGTGSGSTASDGNWCKV